MRGKIVFIQSRIERLFYFKYYLVWRKFLILMSSNYLDSKIFFNKTMEII